MNDSKRSQIYHQVRRCRRITKPVCKMTEARRGVLLNMPIEDFFSVPFLSFVFGKEYHALSLHASVPIILYCISYRWPDIETYGDVLNTPHLCQELVDMSGFGGSALTILIDACAAFGDELDYAPVRAPDEEPARVKQARRLAKSLGIAA